MVFYSATLIENEDGNRIMLHASKPTQREALAKQLLTPSADGKLGSKKVKLKKEKIPFMRALEHLRKVVYRNGYTGLAIWSLNIMDNTCMFFS